MYHTRTYRLLGVSEPGPAASATPDDWPPSMREWYGFDGAIAVASRGDSLRSPNHVERIDTEEGPQLLFMDENQGVCHWAVQLTGADDPPVVVSVDDGPWQPFATSFSDFVFCAVWDVPEWQFGASAQASPLESDDRRFLQREAMELTRTSNWPANQTFRFELPDVRILLWSGETHCDWFVFAPTAPVFARTLKRILPLSDLRTALYGFDEASEKVLQEVRGGGA